MKLVLLFSILIAIRAFPVCGQTAIRIEEGSFPTQAVDTNPSINPKKHEPKESRYLYIIKYDTKKTLNGNKCFEEVTHKYGFEYLIMPKDHRPEDSELSRFFHNFGVKFLLFFRNGPFWQIKLKKKYNQCKYQYGDFVG